MDPLATLRDADQALSDLELDNAAYLLSEYLLWRIRGGLEPLHCEPMSSLRGDKFAEYLNDKLTIIRKQAN